MRIFQYFQILLQEKATSFIYTYVYVNIRTTIWVGGEWIFMYRRVHIRIRTNISVYHAA